MALLPLLVALAASAAEPSQRELDQTLADCESRAGYSRDWDEGELNGIFGDVYKAAKRLCPSIPPIQLGFEADLPAAAQQRNAGTPTNPGKVELIVIGGPFGTMAQTRDHAAMILGHELAHSCLKHRADRERLLEQGCEAHLEAIGFCSSEPSKDCEGVPSIQKALKGMIREQEQQADERGREFMVAAGYDDATAFETFCGYAELNAQRQKVSFREAFLAYSMPSGHAGPGRRAAALRRAGACPQQ